MKKAKSTPKSKRNAVCPEERAKFAAEAKVFEQKAIQAKYEAMYEQLSYEDKKRKSDEELAGNKYHRVFRFTDQVDDDSVARCMNMLDVWHRHDPKAPITIIICSPGGSVIAGLALYDYLLDLRKKGHHITTIARGYAASMGAVLMQAGSKRIVGKESWTLIHEISAGAMGKLTDLEDRTEWLRRVCDRIVELFAKRMSETSGKSLKWCRTTVRHNWQRKDWWISSNEALKLGLADEIEG